MINEILFHLDFHLFPPSPYSEGYMILENAGYTSIIPGFQSMVNGICGSQFRLIHLMIRL